MSVLHRVTLPIGESDVALATQAAYWLERFYPGISARVGERCVELIAEKSEGFMLERVWQAALHNERLHVANVNKRRELLEGLIG